MAVAVTAGLTRQSEDAGTAVTADEMRSVRFGSKERAYLAALEIDFFGVTEIPGLKAPGVMRSGGVGERFGRCEAYGFMSRGKVALLNARAAKK
jgi:hypothetical protein